MAGSRKYHFVILIIVSVMVTSSCTIFRHKQKKGRGVIIESRPAGRMEPGDFDQMSGSAFAPVSAKKKQHPTYKKQKKRKRR